MKIEDLKTNHFSNPLGVGLAYLRFSWMVKQTGAGGDCFTRVQIAKDVEFLEIVHDSGRMESYGKPYYRADFKPLPCTRYYWRIEMESDEGEVCVSSPAWFETAFAKGEWSAAWIGAAKEEEAMPCLYKTFQIKKELLRARLYSCGLGLYECYLGEEKIGDEFLMPGYHSYDLLKQYQTYDVTEQLSEKEEHTIRFILGEGWYKGRFVFDGGYENLYGDRKLLTAALILHYKDGTVETIATDKSWRAVQTEILENGIYDGETIDRDRQCKEIPVAEQKIPVDNLAPRINAPLRKVQKYTVKELIKTPSGDTVLDFGEAVTGWVEVWGAGHMDFVLQYGEVLQEGEFYRDNLRTAKAEFRFRGDSKGEWLRPHFTYFGFRYVKVTGIEKVNPEEFIAYRLMSDMETAGEIITSNPKINQLIQNTFRSQQCNFIDIPLDCPQRDERMGWTGDIAIFVRTASFHMHTAVFLHHYMHNLIQEQKELKGAVPFFVPKPKPAVHEGINPFLVTAGASVWGDAAAIVPWELYLHYHDRDMLKLHYPAMCAWVKYIDGRARQNKNPYLWQNDGQLGDWLALDNGDLNNPIGRTDSGLIASAYYYYSTGLCQKAAAVLGKKEEQEEWGRQKEKIRGAFIEEFLDEGGELKGNKTQTAYALLLYMGLYRTRQREVLVKGLLKELKAYGNHISTGFVGTGILMHAMMENGLQKEAYSLLLKEDYPSWLREVNLGATTIWERWNSLDDDGKISGTGMNSLNHYAYGAVAGWMYEFMCGFRWDEKGGFYIKPMPDRRISRMEGRCRTIYGECRVRWEYQKNGNLEISVDIPFQARTAVILPSGETKILGAGKYSFTCAGCEKEKEDEYSGFDGGASV